MKIVHSLNEQYCNACQFSRVIKPLISQLFMRLHDEEYCYLAQYYHPPSCVSGDTPAVGLPVFFAVLWP